MREPSPAHEAYGLIAEFSAAEQLLDAVRRTRAAGYRRFEAYAPFPVEGLTEALGFREAWTPVATLAGGIAGALLGYGMQVYANLDFPIGIRGTELLAPEPFALITFETMVLGAVLASVLTMLVRNGLPRLHHPLFEVERFHLASSDRFFLAIQSNDPAFKQEKARRFLESLSPARVSVVPFAETAP